MKTDMFKHSFAVGLLMAMATAFLSPVAVKAQATSGVPTERLSDKQLRQMLNWMETDSREIGKQARELEERSRAIRDELNIRIATNETQSPGDRSGGTSSGAQGLAVSLTFESGEVLEFRQDQSKCFDDWVGARFTQKNCRADNGYWHVSFRPDTTSDRVEVVVELGHVTSDVNAPFTAGGYTFKLTQDGQEIASQKIPFHFWGGRWRWQSEERPILKTCEDIKDDPFLPRLEKSKLDQKPPRPEYSGPFTMPEFNKGMGTSGERDSIGVVTTWTAHCLLGAGIDEQDLIDLAADYSASPVHHFRPASGEMLDITKPENSYRTFHSNSKGKDHWIATASVDWKDYPTFIKFDSSHMPSLFYVPYILTGDPFWLEELQYVTSQHMLNSSWARRVNESGQVLSIVKSQLRGFAWAYRDVMHAHALTPDNAPDWLFSRAYYDRLLDDVLIELTAIMNDPGTDIEAVLRQRYNIMWASSGKIVPIWQNDFNLAVWGLGVRAGYEQFRPWFEWLLVSANERTKDNGWDRRVPSFYNADVRKMDFTSAQDWPSLFPVYQKAYPDRFKTPINKWPEDSYWETRKQYSGYADYTYGGLVVAEWLGYDVPGLDYLAKARAKKDNYDKWSFKR